jgi:hypothetical protein
MSRGELDRERLERINATLPDLDPRLDAVIGLSPDIISIQFPPESGVPTAAVCLSDAVHTLAGVRYALFECSAHGVFYREVAQPPDEMVAVYFERYYVDDAALRLYSAAEHVANALIFMLEISSDDLGPYRESRTSQQAAVGRFLAERRSQLSVSRSVADLARSTEWGAAMIYRNEWVHDQPPTVEGLGIVYHRGTRWRTGADGSLYLGIGGGDSPRYTTAELIRIMRGGFDGIVRVLDESMNHYDSLLESRGIRGLREGGQNDG